MYAGGGTCQAQVLAANVAANVAALLRGKLLRVPALRTTRATQYRHSPLCPSPETPSLQPSTDTLNPEASCAGRRQPRVRRLRGRPPRCPASIFPFPFEPQQKIAAAIPHSHTQTRDRWANSAGNGTTGAVVSHCIARVILLWWIARQNGRRYRWGCSCASSVAGTTGRWAFTFRAYGRCSWMCGRIPPSNS